MATTTPDIAFLFSLGVPARQPGAPALSVPVLTAVSGEALADMAAADLCGQLKNLVDANVYNSEEYFKDCERRLEMQIGTQRGIAWQQDPKLHKALVEMHVDLTRRQVNVLALASSMSTQPNKLNVLWAALQARGAQRYCEVGFGVGDTAMAAIMSHPETTVLSFESTSSDLLIAVDDYIDTHFPNRLEIPLGDTTVMLSRYAALKPDYNCGTVFIDAAQLDQVAFLDALVDMPTLSEPGARLFINVPQDAEGAHATSEAIREARMRGEITVEGVVRDSMPPSVLDLASMSDSEVVAGALIVARLAGSAQAEVPATP